MMSASAQPGQNPKPTDAAARVTVSQDSMTAHLEIDPPENSGQTITSQMIDAALKKAGVIYGMDTDLLERIKSHPEYSKDNIIARGRPAVNGTDGSIRYLFRTSSGIRPRQLPDGTVDFRDLGLIQNVRKGQALCEIVLPTAGTAGISVTGRTLLPVQGSAVASPLGCNTTLSADGTRLTAASDGQLVFSYPSVSVMDTFIVREDVDNSTGNIKFVGNVQVNGNVREGFAVEAGGNVEIGGTAEGGIVIAAGNIAVHGGIVGMNHGRVECGGDLFSTFIENCEVNVTGSIRAESIMNSVIRCGATLELSGRRARLIGGRCVVAGDILADSIGSPAGLPTSLVIGVEPSAFIRRTALLNENKAAVQQIGKLRQIVRLLDQYDLTGRLSNEKKELLEQSRHSLEQITIRLQKSQEELHKLNRLIEKSGNGRVICREAAFRGVSLTIGAARLAINETIRSSSFINEAGRIVTGDAASS